MRKLVSAALWLALAGGALLPADPAAAQQGRAFGANARFDLADLPPGRLRSDLEALPAPARARALGWLNRFSFHSADVPYLRADPEGGVFYADTETALEGAPAPEQGAIEAITQAEAIALHSRPGAARTVYLDFDGHSITGTAWNASAGVDPLIALPYTTDADAGSFSAAELAGIAAIWHRVAEDLAPFDIDVTTEAPASFGANVGRVLITHRIDANGNAIYPSAAGGVAYLGVFGESSYAYYSPALVFYNHLGGGWPAYVAEASSHEFGHHLGLSHDAAPGTARAMSPGRRSWVSATTSS
jgi:hypothetical protein